jgi:hypothetical protein
VSSTKAHEGSTPALAIPKQSTNPALFTALLRHHNGSETAPGPEPSPAAGRGQGEGAGANPNRQIDKTDKLPEDLAALAAVWDRLPAELRASWVLTAKALTGKGQE